MPRTGRSLIADYEELLLDPAPPARRRVARPAPEPERVPRPARGKPRNSAGFGGPSKRVRLPRVFALALFFVLSYVGLAFFTTMSAPSNVPFGLRVVEWLRDNGAAWLVSDVER